MVTTTYTDKNNDRHSLERRLQDSLFLIVRRNRDDFGWQFPQGKLQENETFRAAAERILQRTGQVDTTDVALSTISPALVPSNVWIAGNGPVGHYQYAYSAALQEKRKQFGAQVFYTRAQYLGGSITPLKVSKKLYKDYAWIARDEVHEYFDAETAKFLSHLLPH
jgi:large subunit ribosomal protein L46